MSLWEDFDGHFEREFPFGLPGDVWQAKDGAIRLEDMTEAHIRACMKIVGEDDAWYARFEEELLRREMEKLLKRLQNTPLCCERVDETIVPFMPLHEASLVTGLPEHFLRNGCRDGTVPHVKSGCKYYVNIPKLLRELGAVEEDQP